MSIRFTVIYASLLFLLAVMIVFLSGPIWGLRLDYRKGEHIRLIQIAIPSFLSYLSGAVAYATAGRTIPEPRGERGKILRAISIGGLCVFAVGFALSTLVFNLTATGSLDGGLNFEQYTNTITLLIGVLGASTSLVATFIFARPNN